MIKISLKSISLTYTTRVKEVIKFVPSCNKLLDAGCSDGYIDYFLKKRAKNMHGIDINEYDISLAKKLNPEVKYKVASLYELPYEKNYFDTIVCIDVLEHLEKDKLAISELSRVLKKKGTLIITVPSTEFPISFDPINYILKYFNKHINIGVWGYGHKRQYYMNKLITLLRKNKLKIKKTKYISHFLTGVFENSYVANILQPLTKSDPDNKGGKPKDLKKLKKRLSYRPPKIIRIIRDKIIQADKKLFSNSQKSLGILIVAEK